MNTQIKLKPRIGLAARAGGATLWQAVCGRHSALGTTPGEAYRNLQRVGGAP